MNLRYLCILITPGSRIFDSNDLKTQKLCGESSMTPTAPRCRMSMLS